MSRILIPFWIDWIEKLVSATCSSSLVRMEKLLVINFLIKKCWARLIICSKSNEESLEILWTFSTSFRNALDLRKRTRDDEQVALTNFTIQLIHDRIKILDIDPKWNQLLYKEVMQTERKNPPLSRGVKPYRQLKLFKWRLIKQY